MFSFVASFGPPAANANGRNVARMLAATPSTDCNGTRIAEAPDGCAGIRRWNVVQRDDLVAPIWDPTRQFLFAGDVRLYNRPALLQALALTSDGDRLSDLEVGFHAYLRWGNDSPRRLIGDFAFIAWDQRSRTLFAARDQLGMRPLYFTAQGDRLLLASDVQALLPFIDRPHERLNPIRILNGFFPPVSQYGETYFRDVHSLLPGHVLVRTDGGSPRQERYWRPPLAINRNRSYRENCDELLHLFQEAVRARLESDAPLIAHSSGGFDSSTILAAADALYRREPARPPLTMVSAMVPGHAADDSRFMKALASKVSFEWLHWDVIRGAAINDAEVSLTQPGVRRGPGGGPREDLRIAKERSARVLLGGMWGDEVLYAGGIFMDMFRHGRWLDLLNETLIVRRPLARGGRLLAKALPGLLPPMLALGVQRRAFGRPVPRPAWLGPAIRDLYPLPPAPVDGGIDGWPSHLALSLWSRLSSPHTSALLDSIVANGSADGIEVRLPFADVRIVEHLFSVSWQQRLPRGHLRRFGRDALGSLLPSEFNSRLGQSSWTSVFLATNRTYSPYVARVINEGPWLSAPYVVRADARRLLRDTTARAGETHEPRTADDWNLLMKIAGLESWLRLLFCYNSAREVKTCPTN